MCVFFKEGFLKPELARITRLWSKKDEAVMVLKEARKRYFIGVGISLSLGVHDWIYPSYSLLHKHSSRTRRLSQLQKTRLGRESLLRIITLWLGMTRSSDHHRKVTSAWPQMCPTMQTSKGEPCSTLRRQWHLRWWKQITEPQATWHLHRRLQIECSSNI